jgi:hypothetical protein
MPFISYAPSRPSARRIARLAITVAAPVAIVALLSACSASTTSPPSASPKASHTPSSTGTSSPRPSTAAAAKPTSCSVITRAEAAAALGQQVKPPILGKAVVEGGVACVFYGPLVPAGTSPNVAVADSVRVVLVTGPDAKKWFDNYRGKVHAEPIAGLGQEAYYDGYASINVLEGDAYLRIAVGIANNLGVEKTLAKDALARI